MASRRALQLVRKASGPLKQVAKLELTSSGKPKGLSAKQWIRESRRIGEGWNVVKEEARLGSCNDAFRFHNTGLLSREEQTHRLGRPMARRTFAAAAADYPPHAEIGMPSLSPTMTQGNIAKWRKKEGEAVAAGDVLCEIETDKATLEMESMEDGFLAKILKGDGSKDIPVGQAICIVVEEEADADKFADYQADGGASAPPPKKEEAAKPKQEEAAPKPKQEEAKQAAPSSSPKKESPPPQPSGDSSSKGKKFASPAAKKLAQEKGVSIDDIQGTGPNGHIVKADVEDYLAKGPSKAAEKTAEAPKAQKAAAPPSDQGDYEDIPNTMIRKITAQRLLMSKQTIPHYYLSLDVNVDKLVALREKLNAAQAVSGGKKLSLNDFVIKASALALRKVPEANASWTDEFIRRYKYVDVSVAVQTPNGLMVPIVKDADKKGLGAISEDVKRLAEKAKENKLSPAEFQGGTFTVSNLGMYGIKHFCAIINPPQACILAVGTTQKRVLPPSADGQFETGTFMNVTLSCDHRIVDGAIGAQWLGAFKGYIEDPITMIL